MNTWKFVSKPSVRTYTIQNQKLSVQMRENVFPPSGNGLFVAQNIKIFPEERVIDIGTGTGILGILAAKLGGKVVATDTSKEAVELTKQNAQFNKVFLNVQKGPYFAGFKQAFDVIIANLPQELVLPSQQKSIGKQQLKSFSGGPLGNQQILELLGIAKKNMHSKSRFYLLVSTQTDYARTIQKMLSNYDATLFAFRSCSVKPFMAENPKTYCQLNQEGKTHIFKENQKWKSNQYLFELSLKE
ncbi:50S ribosomal protein L11 methyltransferase [Candidatus Micrarchaeota archaeon]|nr:50S ribosomal protein L11 methyltransferase [Candidatus Micrarchaeota archaeon]MBU1930272.1 50S ribosomal protein L11 methyltransferase [Candidatus Micrarchaeota archaeon]